MADYTAAWPPLNTVCTGHLESLGGVARTHMMGAAGSQTLASNRIWYVPFRLYAPSVAVKMSYVVGSTANGNVDLGIYDGQKNLIVNSGSTAQGAASTVQTVDITDAALTPGRYFMAITGSSGTGTCLATSGVGDEIVIPLAVMYEESAGSFGLPASATPAPSTQATPILPALAVHFDALV